MKSKRVAALICAVALAHATVVLAIGPGVPAACTGGDVFADGSFEATDPVTFLNPNYILSSTNFGSPLCDLVTCGDSGGTAGPRTGAFWAWFGGIAAAESAGATQMVLFPSGGASVTLHFYLRVGLVSQPYADMLEVKVDGVTQTTITEPTDAEAEYSLRSVDLSAFADGAVHPVTLLYSHPADGSVANFNVDDISLDVVCGLSVAAIQPTSGPADSATSVTVTGAAFDSGAALVIGDLAATGVTVPDAGTLLGSTPFPLTPGTLYDVTVTNPEMAVDAGAVLVEGWFADFLDVPQGNTYHDFIESIVRSKITAGCGTGTTYCPLNPVTRAQMAVFLLKGKNGPAYAPPACAGIFTDVACLPTPAFAVDWIEALFNAGITAGCGGGTTFCPDQSVTRAQMAVFLLKAEHGSAYAPPACAGVFTDVACLPTPAFAVSWIEQLYNENITGGCGPGPAYCPDNPVRRDQMAVFLSKTFAP